ncbi:MAG: antibiotic biosynthesis monooxygenase [Acetobacteraceae bacterium]|nr:antibiotic biosynthesis monooxygenase [Acetobacteraceae bacterium]
MFAVIFEVRPKQERWDDYLTYAKLLRPDLEGIDGFIDNIRYGSKRRPGWVLSLSTWREEKALVRWRTQARHHGVQEKGRSEVFEDYHLRVGEITSDTRIPPGQALRAQRLDETEAGPAKAVSIVDIKRPPDLAEDAPAEDIARRLGWRADLPGLLAWDVYDAILTPGDLLLLLSWHTHAAADEADRLFPREARLRRVRIIRDYGMFDRREAPQYYPEIAGRQARR